MLGVTALLAAMRRKACMPRDGLVNVGTGLPVSQCQGASCLECMVRSTDRESRKSTTGMTRECSTCVGVASAAVVGTVCVRGGSEGGGMPKPGATACAEAEGRSGEFAIDTGLQLSGYSALWG